MNRQPFLVAVGDNCVDYYVQTRTGYPGGNPVNVAVYFTRLGGRAAYIGAVGTDEGGALICDGLRRKTWTSPTSIRFRAAPPSPA